MATPPDFSVGQVLTAAHMDAVGLWLVKTQTVGTGVSSETVSDAFSADYDNYRIVVTGVDCSANGAGGYFTLSASTGNTYYSAGYYMAYSSAVLTGTNQNGTGNGGLWTVSGTERNDAVIDIFGPNTNTKTAWSVQWSNDIYPGVSQGYDSNTAQHTGFVLKAPAGTTLTGGTIRVYGYRN